MLRLLTVVFVVSAVTALSADGLSYSPLLDNDKTTENEQQEEKLSIDYRVCPITSFYYSDSEPEEFRLDYLWCELEAHYKDANVVFLLDIRDEKPLRKAYVRIPFVLRKEWKDFFTLKFGLVDVPFGYLPRLFPYELRLPYPQVFNALFDGTLGFYDLGISLSGRLKTKTGSVSYELALLNGEYATHWEDTTASKAVVASLSFSPLRDFHFGVSVYNGEREDPSGERSRRYRFGAYTALRYRRVSLIGEYIHGNDNTDTNNRLRTDGAYIEAGYYLWRHPKLWDAERSSFYGAELLLRWDMLDPPKEDQMRFYTRHTHRKKYIYTVALAIDISAWVRITAYYSKLDFGRYWSGYYFGVKDNDDRAGVILSLIF